MRSPDDIEVGKWLEKAGGDIRMAELALSDECPLWDQACFHSQQAAEKALKALLVAMDREVPRSHDLVMLAGEVHDVLSETDSLVDAIAVLNQFGVAPRYPSWLANETEEEAQEAMNTARRILDAVHRCLAGSNSPP